MTRSGWFLLLLASAIAVGPGTSKADGREENGQRIVNDICASCHGGRDDLFPKSLESSDAPPFRTIVENPLAFPPSRLRRALVQPHWQMAGTRLTTQDVDDVIAYIQSLRSEHSQ